MARVTFRELFSSDALSTFGTPLTTGDIIVALLISFATGLFIFFIYKKTYSGVLYSKNFNITIIMATMVSTVIIIAIAGNLALSLGMIGALSIIRFRTPVKDPKDITFLFWAIAVGIINGIQFYKLSILSSAMIGAVLFVFSKRITLSNPYVLILKYSDTDQKKVSSALKKYCSKFKTRNNAIDESGIAEKTIEIKIEEDNVDKLLKELKGLRGVKKVMIFSHTGELSE
jgi:uncharacterized membrane protein YhiD involved in acid resistance|tara:strand:- start:349 stop:1035 length:687 start_codon:yes stop_codon:yes gene_type:complete